MSEPTAPTPVVPRRRFPLKMLLVASGTFLLGFIVGVSASPSSSTVTSASSTPAATVTVTSDPLPAETVTVTAAPAGPAGSISDDGTFLVGSDIKPGTYKTAGGQMCYWARLSDTSGNGIINNGVGAGQQVVTVAASDKAFETRGCGEWRRVS